MRFAIRVIVGLCFALLMVTIVAAAQAAPLLQDEPPVPGSDECIGCHEGLRDYWEHSEHAQAFDNPEFQSAWREQGEPQACLACHTTGYDPATGEYDQAGIGCLTCHYPIVSDHPDQYMPTDVSSRLCGECHLETFSEWQESHHAQEDLACSRCHNQHTTQLRVGSSQELCQTCHEDEAKFFALTAHAGEGLLCTDCHLQVGDSAIGEGHGIREHSFEVDLDTCNLCHEGDMHADFDSGQAMTTKDNVACYRTDVERVAVTKEEPVSETPPAPSPIVYALPAGFGLIFGVLVAPWAEGLIRRRNGGK